MSRQCNRWRVWIIALSALVALIFGIASLRTGRTRWTRWTRWRLLPGLITLIASLWYGVEIGPLPGDCRYV